MSIISIWSPTIYNIQSLDIQIQIEAHSKSHFEKITITLVYIASINLEAYGESLLGPMIMFIVEIGVMKVLWKIAAMHILLSN